MQAKGLGYALNTTEELKFVTDIASTTGVVLDPVYRCFMFPEVHCPSCILLLIKDTRASMFYVNFVSLLKIQEFVVYHNMSVTGSYRVLFRD